MEAGAQRYEKILRHVPGLQSHRLHSRPVDIQPQRRRVERLLNVNVHGARDVPDFIGKFLRHLEVSPKIVARDGDINGSGRSEIQNLRHNVRRLEEKLHARKLLRQSFAKFIDIRGSRLTAFLLQLHEDFRVRRSESSRIAVAEIDAAVGHADVIQNRFQLLGWNRFPDYRVYLVGKARCLFNPQPRARPEVQADLSCIHLGEKVPSQDKDEAGRENAETQER